FISAIRPLYCFSNWRAALARSSASRFSSGASLAENKSPRSQRGGFTASVWWFFALIAHVPFSGYAPRIRKAGLIPYLLTDSGIFVTQSRIKTERLISRGKRAANPDMLRRGCGRLSWHHRPQHRPGSTALQHWFHLRGTGQRRC